MRVVIMHFVEFAAFTSKKFRIAFAVIKTH